MKWIWTGFGMIALALGAIGVVLPLLPTVPFVILAAFCFAKGSENLHNHLINHKVFGPQIEDWRRYGAISRRAKLAATVSVGVVFGISLILGLRADILAIQGVALIGVMVFIWSRPSGPR